MQMTLTVDGLPVVDRTLARFVAALVDATPAFEEIADQFGRATTANFARQGNGWAPLSARYAAYKAKHFPGRPILVRTGALRESLTRRPFGVDRITPHSGEYGTAVGYAKYHQQGTDRMPARPPLRVTENARRNMTKTLQRFLVQAGER